jgi:hypothetical protein
MQKKNEFFFSFSSASTFGETRGTNKRAKNKTDGSSFAISKIWKMNPLTIILTPLLRKEGQGMVDNV